MFAIKFAITFLMVLMQGKSFQIPTVLFTVKNICVNVKKDIFCSLCRYEMTIRMFLSAPWNFSVFKLLKPIKIKYVISNIKRLIDLKHM